MEVTFKIYRSVRGNSHSMTPSKYPIGSEFTGTIRGDKLYMNNEGRGLTGNVYIPLEYLEELSVIRIGGE